MDNKIKIDNMDNLLKSLKTTSYNIPDDFTNKVMDRIKNNQEFSNDTLDNIDDMLYNLSLQEEVKPDNNFTEKVMQRVKTYKETVYNEKNVEDLLYTLKNQEPAPISNDFTNKVMVEIKSENMEDNIIQFDKVYKKFIAASIFVAAAAVLLALNLFSHYDAATAEYMVTDYFNTGIY